MELLLASLLVLPVIEYFIRLPFLSRAKALLRTSNKAVHIISSTKISDHWKEIVLLRYSQKLAIHTVIIALMLVGGFSLVVLPALLLDWLFVPKLAVIESLSTLLGLMCMTISSTLYIILRKYYGNE